MFFSESKGDLILILDVQSSIVRGTLVIIHEKGLPNIVWTYSIPITYKVHAHSGYLVKMALRNIHEIINEVLKYIHLRSGHDSIPKKLSEVHFVLSSPWVVSQAKTLELSFKKKISISRDYISNIIADERRKLASTDTKDLKVIEEKVFDVRLNGYSVANWDKQETKELEVSFVLSLAGDRMVQKFTDNCKQIVNYNKIYFHSSLFLQHLGIQKVVNDTSSYALIHIHGELTDVALIHAHSCTFFGSYPFGIRNVVRTLARENKINERTAESILNMSVSGNLDLDHSKKELNIVDNMSKGWISEFKKLIKTGTNNSVLPHKIIISANSHEDFFVKSFKNEYPQLELSILAIENIIPFVNYDMHAERLRLTGLYVIAISNIIK